jgi:1-deoxy-D-xylulose-5-phosphate synthase
VELKSMVQTIYELDNIPTALRFPRGSALGLEKLNDLFGYDLEEYPTTGEALPVGKGRIVREGRDGARERVAILSIGTRLAASVEAARALEAAHPDMGVTVADARWMKPLDTELIQQLAADNSVMVTVEEGSIGGFGDHVLHYLALSGLLDDGALKVRPMVLPDKYIEAGSQKEQYEEAGLTTEFIENTVRKLCGIVTLSGASSMQ